MKYVHVILPLAIRSLPTYEVPDAWRSQLLIGHRVEVQFGKSKRYTGIVSSFSDTYPGSRQPKPILNILDENPVIHRHQLELWEWMADYYCCTIGEVMQAALPASLKLQSETLIILNGDFRPDEWVFNDAENLLIEALIHRNELSLQDADQILSAYSVYAVVNALFKKEVILIKERLKEVTGVKTRTWVDFAEFIKGSEEAFLEVLDIVAKSKHQTRTLLALYELSKKGPVDRKILQKKAKVTLEVLKALQKKEIITLEEKPYYEQLSLEQREEKQALSQAQSEALEEVKKGLAQRQPVLLNGVTGSGKTHIYISILEDVIKARKQALFLLPEIALTSQLINRLQEVFGEQVLTYHSGLNDRERATVWNAVYEGHPIILGARSALFLPFKNLDLIIVDEEHDGSYKQHDPAPRYQARDIAILLQAKWSLKVILGSATPSLESRWNVQQGKYREVKLQERFGQVSLPDLVLLDLKKEVKDKRLDATISVKVVEKIQSVVEDRKQVLIFQNRRGYAPVAQCHTCGWHAECPNCDVSLTYHKVFKNIRCHYCGHRESIPHLCPQCGSPHVDYKGFGTERIEDEMKIIFPEYRIARMDYDTAGGKKNRERLISRMEDQELDILIGTQMITKGLDFDNIGLVVVVSADQLLFYPHFRTNERGFQMLQQVSGRAGRKEEGSEVLIQGYDTKHPVLAALLSGQQEEFFEEELKERERYHYPPFFRLIEVEAKHKKPDVVKRAMDVLAQILRHQWGGRILGPAEPDVARIRGYFIKVLMIKIEKRSTVLVDIKKHLQTSIDEVHKGKGLSGVRFNINVDP